MALKESYHPRGKSLTLTIEGEHIDGPLFFAQIGIIVQYQCGNFARGQSFVLDRYLADMVGSGSTPGQEMEEWRRSLEV